MYTIISEKPVRIPKGDKNFLEQKLVQISCDTENDLPDTSDKNWSQGSIVNVSDTGNFYTLNSSGEWKNVTINSNTHSDENTGILKIGGRVDTVSELPNETEEGTLYFVGYATDDEKAEYVMTTDGEWELLGFNTAIVIDSTLSSTSMNPVQNKVLYSKFDNLLYKINDLHVSWESNYGLNIGKSNSSPSAYNIVIGTNDELASGYSNRQIVIGNYYDGKTRFNNQPPSFLVANNSSSNSDFILAVDNKGVIYTNSSDSGLDPSATYENVYSATPTKIGKFDFSGQYANVSMYRAVIPVTDSNLNIYGQAGNQYKAYDLVNVSIMKNHYPLIGDPYFINIRAYYLKDGIYCFIPPYTGELSNTTTIAYGYDLTIRLYPPKDSTVSDIPSIPTYLWVVLEYCSQN